MSQDLVSLGKLFVDRREELNLSLKAIESATSIRMVYLEAIEAGEVDKLISPIYAQGFVRQYAAFLGLDGDRIVMEHAELFRRPSTHVQEFAYGIGTLEPRGHFGGGVKWVPNLLWIVAILLLFFISYLVARALDIL